VDAGAHALAGTQLEPSNSVAGVSRVAQHDSPRSTPPSPHSLAVSHANCEKPSHVPSALHGGEGANQPLSPSFKQHTVSREHQLFAPQRIPGSGSPETAPSDSPVPESIAASGGVGVLPSNTRHAVRRAPAPRCGSSNTKRARSGRSIGVLSVQIDRTVGRSRVNAGPRRGRGNDLGESTDGRLKPARVRWRRARHSGRRRGGRLGR
jgi:hypothetical protein